MVIQLVETGSQRLCEYRWSVFEDHSCEWDIRSQAQTAGPDLARWLSIESYMVIAALPLLESQHSEFQRVHSFLSLQCSDYINPSQV